MASQVKPSARQARRLATRERVLAAATAEFKRSGMAAADVGAIVAAAGVAHGTFYFHFPSKEHVLLELERQEEARIATEFARFLETSPDLAAALTEVVRLVMGLEHRLGAKLFRELLALHFSPSRPQRDDWTDHPVIVLLVREIKRGRGEGDVHSEVDAFLQRNVFPTRRLRGTDHHRQPRSSRHVALQACCFSDARFGDPMSRSHDTPASVRNPPTRRSNHGLGLGDSSLRRRLGWHLPDHRLLVLDVLQHRNVLIATEKQ